MLLAIVFVRIALSAVFGIAGVTKLIDQPGTRKAVKDFGAPNPLAPTLAFVLPFLELSVAAGLLFSNSVWWSALAGLLLLGLFVVAIGVNLAQGRTHDCHCFGQLYSRPLGWSTLVRNVVFALGAVFLLLQGRSEPSPDIMQTLVHLSVTQWLSVLGVLIVAAAILFYLQKRRKRLEAEAAKLPLGLPVDSIAPHFDLPAYDGGSRSLDQLLSYGKPLLLIFTNPLCGPCIVLFEEIKNWQQAHSHKLTIALISRGTIKENFVNVAKNGLGQVLLQKAREVGEKYGATATPTAVLVNTDGRIASLPAAGGDEIRKLLDTIVGNPVSSNNGHQPKSGDSQALQ
ncbi:MAG TPA: hypothetical protein DHU55_00330 [Blastocatellia bacterium]|jgi:peroxiredoxin/uncharacterized membrane protein YphA (DoxX/SURF4 family)|nr:hypothetical protein [Blastocatellia bacterium]HAF25417.1 hypothetical protein [Blastocatellia bacterium]HCX28215.1 hypothetical protein [Blastocatellia bacterium]